MRILAIDTCFGAVSVALGWTEPNGASRIAHRYEERRTGHAERLYPMIAEVLGEAGLTRVDVDRVAATIGPGSFTGVRIVIAAARGFRLASGCEIVGATSLEVMARTAIRRLGRSHADRELIVAVDARRGEIYLQRFSASVASPLDRPTLAGVETIATTIETGASVLIVGSGATALAAAALARGVAAEALLPELEPDALDLLDLAPGLAPTTALVPLYVRAPDAKPPASPAIARVGSEGAS